MAIQYSQFFDCAEEHNTRIESFLADSTQCSVTLRCAFVDRTALAFDLKQNRRAWPHAIEGKTPQCVSAVVRTVPDKSGVDGQALTYIQSLVDVMYNTDAVFELISEELEPTMEYTKMDPKLFRWALDGLALPADKSLLDLGDPIGNEAVPGRPFRGMSIVRTIRQQSLPLPVEFYDLIGFINSEDYDSTLLGRLFPAGTLLYHPPVLSRSISSDLTSDGADIVMKLQYKPDGWNKFWRESIGAYARFYVPDQNRIDGSTEAAHFYDQFPEADFAPILFDEVIQNEQQTLQEIAPSTTGVFQILTFFFEQTVDIAFNDDAATVQAALLALNVFAAGDVVATGGPLGTAPIVLTFGNSYANTNVPVLDVVSDSTDGKYEIVTTQQGCCN